MNNITLQDEDTRVVHYDKNTLDFSSDLNYKYAVIILNMNKYPWPISLLTSLV